MYTYNDLVAALQNGVTVEDIAAQMSKDLNAAKAEYDRLSAERAEAEKKAATEARKRLLITNFYTALGDYVTEFYPDSAIAEMIQIAGTPTDEDLDSFAEQMDSLVLTYEAIKGLAPFFGNVEFDSPVFAKPNSKLGNLNNKAVEIDPIEAFLNDKVRKKK